MKAHTHSARGINNSYVLFFQCKPKGQQTPRDRQGVRARGGTSCDLKSTNFIFYFLGDFVFYFFTLFVLHISAAAHLLLGFQAPASWSQAGQTGAAQVCKAKPKAHSSCELRKLRGVRERRVRVCVCGGGRGTDGPSRVFEQVW